MYVNKNDNDLQKSSQGREMVDVIREYTEYSTIQGLIYLSLPKQTQGGKFFWSAVILGMLILGSYWSVEAYQVNKNSTCLFKLTTCQGGIFFICYHFISSLHIAWDIFSRQTIFSTLRPSIAILFLFSLLWVPEFAHDNELMATPNL